MPGQTDAWGEHRRMRGAAWRPSWQAARRSPSSPPRRWRWRRPAIN